MEFIPLDDVHNRCWYRLYCLHGRVDPSAFGCALQGSVRCLGTTLPVNYVLLSMDDILRLSILFHDMAHDAFFPRKNVNRIVAVLVGGTPVVKARLAALTRASSLACLCTPYSDWCLAHNVQHHTRANKADDEVAMGRQTAPWSVERFHKEGVWMRIAYTLIYGPLLLWTILPVVRWIIECKHAL